jgi:hypothetical protein
MTESLPAFRYHPDPLASGSVQAATVDCLACGEQRSYVYVGPVYAEGEYSGKFCPWCIADGTAATTLDAEFTDVGSGVPPEIAASVLDEISHRTPRFDSWRQDHWLYHCGDACAFLGPVGRPELERFPDVLEMLVHENDSLGWSESESRMYVDALDAEGEATAYLFRCLVCGMHLAFSDSA